MSENNDTSKITYIQKLREYMPYVLLFLILWNAFLIFDLVQAKDAVEYAQSDASTAQGTVEEAKDIADSTQRELENLQSQLRGW